MDYTRRRRIKLWGTAWFVEGDAELVKSLMPDGYRAQPEQVFMFSLSAWDANCPQHIPKRVDLAEMEAVVAAKDRTILELTEQVAELTRQLQGMRRRSGLAGLHVAHGRATHALARSGLWHRPDRRPATSYSPRSRSGCGCRKAALSVVTSRA